jgi:hypothetical protein
MGIGPQLQVLSYKLQVKADQLVACSLQLAAQRQL